MEAIQTVILAAVQTPEIRGTAGILEVAEIQATLETAATPEIPEIQATLGTPEIVEIPETAATLEIPEIVGVPGTVGVPETLEAPVAAKQRVIYPLAEGVVTVPKRLQALSMR